LVARRPAVEHLLLVHAGEVHVGPGEVRIELDRPLKQLQGLSVILLGVPEERRPPEEHQVERLQAVR
jgi:hypothetical protein